MKQKINAESTYQSPSRSSSSTVDCVGTKTAETEMAEELAGNMVAVAFVILPSEMVALFRVPRMAALVVCSQKKGILELTLTCLAVGDVGMRVMFLAVAGTEERVASLIKGDGEERIGFLAAGDVGESVTSLGVSEETVTFLAVSDVEEKVRFLASGDMKGVASLAVVNVRERVASMAVDDITEEVALLTAGDTEDTEALQAECDLVLLPEILDERPRLQLLEAVFGQLLSSRLRGTGTTVVLSEVGWALEKDSDTSRTILVSALEEALVVDVIFKNI